MGTTNTITKLEQKLNGEHKLSTRDHKRLIAKHKEGIAIIQQMPKGLADMDWYVFRKLDVNKWYLETWGMDEKNADKLIKKLKGMGVIALPSKHHTFTNTWEYKGYLLLDGAEVVVKVDGGSKPQNCTIEEIRETKEVITYKAHCPDFTN